MFACCLAPVFFGELYTGGDESAVEGADGGLSAGALHD